MKKNKEYSRCHAAIHRKHGKASKCEATDCTYPNPKRFEWALRQGREYTDNAEDYIQLCPSCHRKYDFTEKHRKNMSESHKGLRYPTRTGRKHERSIPIIQCDLNGNPIKEWESITQCVKTLGIHKQGIQYCLSGKMKQSFGFIFKKANPMVQHPNQTH